MNVCCNIFLEIRDLNSDTMSPDIDFGGTLERKGVFFDVLKSPIDDIIDKYLYLGYVARILDGTREL